MCRNSGGGERAAKGPPQLLLTMGPRSTEAMGSVAFRGPPFGKRFVADMILAMIVGLGPEADVFDRE